jgi:hypothetical protein
MFLDLGELVRDIILGVLQVGVVTPLVQHLDDVVAVVDPARRGLGRHRDTDRRLALRQRGSGECERTERDGRQDGFQQFHVSLPSA